MKRRSNLIVCFIFVLLALLAAPGGEVLGGDECLAGLDGEAVDAHGSRVSVVVQGHRAT